MLQHAGGVQPVFRPAASAHPFLPTDDVVGYARRLLSRNYRVRPEDIDDTIQQALLDFIRAVKTEGSTSQDGLFVVIVRRRAVDSWRRRREPRPPGVESRFCARSEPGLESFELREHLSWVMRRARLDRGPWPDLVRHILAGDRFPEACKAAGIPEGSRGRYRRRLVDLLEQNGLVGRQIQRGISRDASEPSPRDEGSSIDADADPSHGPLRTGEGHRPN
jgi:hypothetical protein